ncbi:MAG: lipid A phosphoethanolamine transferase [Bacteroidales bacterium]|nr:lipid A phosphoethanolamine transferase [Bacteroidales bacterium]
MKPSEKTSNILPVVLMWLLPLVLIIPNVALDFTEISYSPLERIINVALPLGVYLVLCAAWRRVGRTGLWLIPIMVLCAFQIVLLFLYGESIIAIDMFINVVTTNASEATELLANLGVAVAVVVAVYLPVIILCIIAEVRNATTTRGQRRPVMVSGVILTAIGAACFAWALAADGYRPTRRLFPVNVISNMIEAANRTRVTKAYFTSSAPFRFASVDNRTDSGKEVYVLVIGETSRAGNWQLNGYDRSTNPHLSERRGLVNFSKAMSESNTTHKSVPLLMSHFGAENFADSIFSSKGIIDAFREAGYETAWISNQQRNGALIDFYGEQADSVAFLTDDGRHHYDGELREKLHDLLTESQASKIFVVLHTYGSHFNYKERYPAEFEYFGSDISAEASPENRSGLMNAYDNSIRYVDAVVDGVISELDTLGVPSAMVYLADHGEDIFDDSRNRFLHASPTPTYHQLHVPMLLWMSRDYAERYPAKAQAARANADRNVSSSRSAFHTLLSLADVATEYFDPTAALTDSAYTEPTRLFLNDYNEAVPYTAAGLRKQDFEVLAAKKIAS